MLAWHFSTGELAFQERANTPPIKGGITYRRDPEKLQLCEYGLHASIKPGDALEYAPGSIVSRVRLSGRIVKSHDKCVASVRKHLWVMNADDVLREFARWCALEVIHLWGPPQIVIDYLKTDNEKLRDAAAATARDAAGDAARAAARYAARAAAGVAAEVAVRAAEDAATWAATASAEDAWDAAGVAAWVAARYAAREKQNEQLETLLFQAFGRVQQQ